MTLIAGLVCHGGIVFAADSEESGIIRRSVEKVSTNRRGLYRLQEELSKTKQTALVVAGAGNGTLADYATQRILGEVRFIQNPAEIEDKIAAILRSIYQVNVPLHPVTDPRDADFELLIGVKSPVWPSLLLYSTQGVTVVKRDTFYVCGSGALTEYILDQTYTPTMSVEDGTAAALNMLQLAKTYVGGVGGNSQVMVLNADGSVDEKPEFEISEEENLAKQFSSLSGMLLISALRTRTGTDEQFSEDLKIFEKQMKAFRIRKRKSDMWLDEVRGRAKKTLAREHEKPQDQG